MTDIVPVYEPPRIEDRDAISTPLIGVVISGTPPGASAVFRPSVARESLSPYEPPAIEARDAIDQVAISEILSSTPPPSAVFRPSDRRADQ
jgi:hypothetical protein